MTDRPSKIVCVGRNYALHAAELGNTVPTDPRLSGDGALMEPERRATVQVVALVVVLLALVAAFAWPH